MATLDIRVKDAAGAWRWVPKEDRKDFRRSPGEEVVYRARVRRRGQPAQVATFESLTLAKKWIAKTEGAIVEGRHFDTAEAKRRTFADLCERYAEDVLSEKRPSTQATQIPQLAWWKREIGHLTLRNVTATVIDDALRKLGREPSNRGKPRAPATVNRWHALVAHVLASAVRWSWVDDNPVRRLQKRREPRGRVRWLDARERKQLLDACADGPDWLQPAVLVLMSTGLRLGELKRLRWRDVELTGKVGSITVHESKNDERRRVPLVDPALETLRAWSKVRRLDDDRVFPSAGHNFHRAWYAAVTRSGIENFRVHDLRHTCASLMVMSGASLATVAAMLGHKQIEVTLRYAHLSDQHTRDAVATMAARFLGGVDG
ncbi:MAG: integrase [Deltaproteobacteria bacterium HGW-Deltaproteobacteria-14]|jgi:integrase|nr:MAG: integrase [Deltaproteobacteria bacterium HGW-Deltaproteobacteria-14]